MRRLQELEAAIENISTSDAAVQQAKDLLGIGEEILEHWVTARGMEPTSDTREGFRLLALHRQGSSGDPSFNACRETCRELAYHFNLITMQADDAEINNRLEMMKLVCSHLYLFISGKMQVAELGDFCCSSKPIRLTTDKKESRIKEA
ncbi:MAG: hypothetical protein GWN47_03035 [Woeseiaceae bacterium]|nr:hypothetical protein [Woeseiaceae bacterium]